MFTGIITEVGTIGSIAPLGGGVRISVRAARSAAELGVGDSISLSGACQTVVQNSNGLFTVEAVEETLRKTTLGQLRSGSRVNLELPVRMSDRLGGHLVQGHVDGVGEVRKVTRQASSWLVEFEFPPAFARYVVPVGSIAVDGISLTVAATEANRLTVSLIPHTLANTTLSTIAPGDRVNLEFDLIGKYVEKLLHGEQGGAGGGLTPEKLASWGYTK